MGQSATACQSHPATPTGTAGWRRKAHVVGISVVVDVVGVVAVVVCVDVVGVVVVVVALGVGVAVVVMVWLRLCIVFLLRRVCKECRYLNVMRSDLKYLGAI